MKDSYEIGSSPSGEDCVQLGSDNYTFNAKKECTIFMNQIRRVLGYEPEGSRLAVKGFPHDFGTYYEVSYIYDDENEKHQDYFHKIDTECPEFWDEEAKHELEL